MSKSYLPIRTKTLKSNFKLGFDVYLKLPHKIIHYIKSADHIDDTRLARLKEKKVRKLYILDDAEKLYQEYIDRSLAEVLSSDASIEDKAAHISNTSEAQAEEIFENPEQEKSYKKASKLSNDLVKYLQENDKLLKGIFDKELDDAESIDAIMHKHSVNSLSLVLSFAAHMKLSEKIVEELGIAAIYHDMGFTLFESEFRPLFLKKEGEMSPHELSKYKEHPRLGCDILQDKDFASKEIIDYIHGHEEREGANGYPKKLQTLSQEQALLNLCIYYDRCKTCLGMKYDEIFEEISVNQLGNFKLDLIKSFKGFLKSNNLN